MDNSLANATIRIDADTSSAIIGLKRVSSELNSLVPGGNAVSSVFERIQGGFLQLVQGISRNVFQSLTSSMSKLVSSGLDVAKTIEMAKVGFDNLLESGEDVDKLLLKIQEDAATTPFDTDALTLSTQKIALVTKHGALAEKTVLSLGKALAAAGRGTAEMNRMATNLQQIGQNAKATERDLREFGNAGIDIVGIVTEFSEEFKESGKKVTEARDWLKTIDKPFEVIVNALNNAGDSVEGFANIYTDGAQTIGQAMENMSDSIGIFSYRVMQQATILDRTKNIMKDIQEGLFLDKTFTANTAASISHLLKLVKEADIIQPILKKIKEIVSAFASGQFDNVIVFFKNLFNAIKKFSGFQVVSNFFKTLFDLFSDNHTAEEVAKVATQLGNLVRVFLELKMMNTVGNYAMHLTESLTTMFFSVKQLVTFFTTAASAMTNFKMATMGTIGIVGAIIAAISIFANISGKGFDDVISSIVSGLQNLGKILVDVAKNMVSFGWNLIVGLYNGLVEGFNAVIGKIKEMAQAIVNQFKSVFQIHSPSKVMRDEVGHNIAEGIAIGIRDKYGDIIEAAEDVLDELVSLQDDYVTEMKNFGAIDLVQQVQVYKDFARLYREGTRARLEMDDKVHSAESSIIKEMIDLIDDFNTAYDKAFKKAKDYYDMFEYTQITLTRTTKSVIEGLNRQNDNMTKYYNNIYRMSQMGFDDDFMAYIYEQGMDAASEVAGLADATAEQIEEINDLWRNRGIIAADIATLNTKKLKEETLDELDYLQSGLTSKVLDYYDSGTYLMYNFTRGIYDMIPTLEQAMMRVQAKTSESTKKAADAVSEIDTAANIPEATEDLGEFTAAANKMNIELMDTNDIFSFMKNLLSGMPWWVWAGVALKAVTGVVSGVELFQRKASQASKLGRSAFSNLASGITGNYKKITDETWDWATNSEKAAGQFVKSGDTINGAMGKMSKNVSNSYKRVTTETQKAATKTNSIVYSSTSKVGADIMRPFRTFATRVKGLFGAIQEVINQFLDLFINTVKHFAEGIMSIIETIFGGVGKAIKALLEPLADPALFTSVGVLAALAGTILLLAVAGQVLNGVEWESLGKMAAIAVGLAAVAAVMIALGTQSALIIAGATAVAAAGVAVGVAAAAIGAGIFILTAALTAASNMGQSIETEGFDKIKEALFKVNGMFLEVGILGGVVGAVAGIFSAVVAVEIFAIATCLAGASLLAQAIDISAFDKITEGLKAAGAVFQNAGILGEMVAAVAGVFATIVAVELLVIATSLRLASELGKGLDVDGINKVGEAVKAAGGVFLEMGVLGAGFGAIAGAFAAVISVEFLVIATSLRIASELGKGIDLDALNNVGEAVKKANGIFLEMGVLGAGIGAVVGAFATLVGIEFMAIALALRAASDVGGGINLDNLDNVGEAVKKANGIFLEIGAGGAFVGAIVGEFATIVSVELMTIAVALARASVAAKAIRLEAIPYIGKAIELLNKINFGDFWEAWGDVNTSDKVREIAQNVESIVNSLANAITKIAELQKITENQVLGYMFHAKRLIEILTTIDFGKEGDNNDKKNASEKLNAVTENVDKIISTISDAITKLADLSNKVGKSQIDLYIAHIKTILEKLAGFELTDDKSDDDNGWFSQTKLDKTKQATEKIAGLAEQISKMMEYVKTIVETMSGLEKSGISPQSVERYVSNTKGIIDKFAEIEVSQTVEDSLKDNISKISEVSSNVSTIINSAKSIVETLKGLEDKGITPENVSEYVAKANLVVAKFGELALEEKTDGAYEKLSNNVSNLATATSKVNEILQNASKMVSLVEEYEKAIEGKDVDLMVQHINKMLAQIAGGNAYADGEDNWHQGIKLPDNMEFSENSVNTLDQLKNALDKIKSIAETINSIPDTAEKVGGVTSIINFIKDTMAELPTTLGNYAQEFKGVGEKFVESFKEGWQSSYPTLTQIAEEAQTTLWQAIENKMQDEWYQGEAMANKIVEGFKSVYPNMQNAGADAQGAFWRGLQNKFNDEWQQGYWLGMEVVNGIYGSQDAWWSAGDSVAAGFAGGIERNMWRVNNAAGKLSQTAINKLKELLNIHSPSKVMAELGGYVTQGFAEGITDDLSDVEAAGEKLAKAVMDGYNDNIEPLTISAYEARAAAERMGLGYGSTSTRSTSVIQNNNIYNNMDMSQALSQIAWEVSRS